MVEAGSERQRLGERRSRPSLALRMLGFSHAGP
jgi:hypothetical protein